MPTKDKYITRQEIAVSLTATIDVTRRLVAAIAAGQLILEIPEDTPIVLLRYAPFFEPEFNPNGKGIAYTAKALSAQLGNTAKKDASPWVLCALEALAAIEQGYAPENMLENIAGAKKGFRVSSLRKTLKLCRAKHKKTHTH
jgi:hypothetical protein